MADIKQQFTGLPLGLLVCTPIIEVAKGQAELCRVYLDYVFKLAYKDGKQDGEANVIKFKLNRPVTDGEGNISQQEIEVSAPLISLVPVPAFTMDEATVQFTMEVKEQVVDTSSKDTSTSSQFGLLLGFNAQLSGSVTTSASNTRIPINLLNTIFMLELLNNHLLKVWQIKHYIASVIEPIPTKGSK